MILNRKFQAGWNPLPMRAVRTQGGTVEGGLILLNLFSVLYQWRWAGLKVSVLDSWSSSPGSSPGQGPCLLFLDKTLYCHSASLNPVQMGTFFW